MAIPSHPPPTSPDTSANPNLLLSLLQLSRGISHFDPSPSLLQKRNISSLARKSKLLSLLFEDLLLHPVSHMPRAAILFLKEILALLLRFKALLETCTSRMSRMRLLFQAESVSHNFYDLTHDLSTLLDILPIAELHISDDVEDLMVMLGKQCRRPAPLADLKEETLRSEIIETIHKMESEIIQDSSSLGKIFNRLGLDDSRSCVVEIERLEIEIRDQGSRKNTAVMVSLLGLVRYAKCVLFRACIPRSINVTFPPPDPVFPADFRCPISLEVMTDPVVVASGQTYDRESISSWIESGHATCPKTGQVLSHLELVANQALKSLIIQWCRNQNVPFEATETAPTAVEQLNGGISSNKAASVAARMTALFLVQNLADSPSAETANQIVHELRQLARNGSENRGYIAEAGAIPLLLPLLESDDPSLQVNAVTALLNLSILQANKRRIMQAGGGFEGIVDVLRKGATWQAMENAATTLLSLSSFNCMYRRKVGKDPRVVDGLVELVRAGPASSKRDGLVTIMNLARDRENIAGMMGGDVVEVVLEALGVADVAHIAAAALAAIAKRGGAPAVAAAGGSVAKMVGILKQGPEKARESAVATLVLVCREGGGGARTKLATTPGIEWTIGKLMWSGSERARRNAAMLGQICQKWASSAKEEKEYRFDRLSITAVSMAGGGTNMN